MDKQESISTWLKFFKDAGIPTKVGASYALIFAENRIHKDMLTDLTVDYLRLMGITLMGDIIAILRHCKSVHQDSLRKVVILQSKEEGPKKINRSAGKNVETSSCSSSSSSSSSSDEDDVRIVEVSKSTLRPQKTLTTNKPIIDQGVKIEGSLYSDSKQIRSQLGLVTKNSSSKPAEAMVLNESINSFSDVPTVSPGPKQQSCGLVKEKNEESLKRKYSDESEYISQEEETSKTIPSSYGRSILKTTLPPEKKVCLTTESAVHGPKLPPSKKTVFERLGAETGSSQVSSTTELPKSEVMDTKFTRVISNVRLPVNTVKVAESIDTFSHTKTSSVFQRLGGVNCNEERVGSALEYAGVLKSPTLIKKSPIKRPIVKRNLSIKMAPTFKCIGTMRADEPEVPIKVRAAEAKSSLGRVSPAKNRQSPLQSGLQRQRLLKKKSEGIFANGSNPTTNVSVKQRLGLTTNSGESLFTGITKQRLKRTTSPTTIKRDERDLRKKVSFGNVERRLISSNSPMARSKFSQGGFKSRTSVHSRLGTPKYV